MPIGRQLNPFKRKRDKPVAYWSGIVDVNGEQDFQYTVPDYFHGKLHVMAVAVSPDLIGTAEGATTVRGDFVLSPDAPTTLAPGDEADVGVGVSNNLSGAGRPAGAGGGARSRPGRNCRCSAAARRSSRWRRCMRAWSRSGCAPPQALGSGA